MSITSPPPLKNTLRLFLQHRLFSTGKCLRSRQPAITASPAPPRLPKDDQELFERLQRSSTGAFSTPQPPSSTTAGSSTSTTSAPPSRRTANEADEHLDHAARVSGNGEELHPDFRKPVKPEFEGDVNPRTGEVGGPKNEPLRWGAGGDWSYKGRTTDF